ncbi:AraC family transcriptional regulator [Marinimicrobium sp. ABcell2]|uniref:AraC family transcriptional regulator n=1 Tax=Marinimicrobium sp. ABcell2 TaxID=3069751 RepID=UPI0027AEF72A|nr:AraC family transcriptional regulator [Marinimicrobium sp. ABcell2]MDQ2078409.1 AraC family transcriptional regulator ligand-binding domain-containing protein [Marinimicrobium sp. ABcell2]
MDKVSDQGVHPLKETYSKFALQIISAYHKWQDRDANELGTTRAPRESALLEKEAHEIWALALEVSDDEHLGLHAGAALVQHINGHFLTTLAANSKTVGEALENFCQYHELCSDALHPKLERRTSTVAISVTGFASVADDTVMRHMCECMFSALVTILSVLCKQPIRPAAVRFTWPSPGITALHESVLKAPVHFESKATELEFSNATLNTAIPYADEILLSTLLQYADSQLDALNATDSWSKKVRSVACHPGMSMDLDISTVARNLGVSPRTLQQRLKSEGVSFQDIMREVKLEMAKDYLANGSMPLSEIALLLGYSEQSAFNHAFKGWTGLTPKQFRKSCFE